MVSGVLVFAVAMVVAGAGSGYIRATVANAATRAAGDENHRSHRHSVSGDRFLALHLPAAGLALVAAGFASQIGREGTAPGSRSPQECS